MAEPKKSQRPVPTPTPLTQPFWEAAKNEQLVLQFDRQTGATQFWPRPVSMSSGRGEMDWRECSGKGALYAWTRVHVPFRGFEDEAPYIVGAVDLVEGARVVARLVNTRIEDLTPGMKFRVAWEAVADDINLYVFEPDL